MNASTTRTVRQVSAYGAIALVLPYLLIKIAWTAGLFLPTEEMGEASWRAINATTAVLAAVAVVLALAFVRPWGERVPAVLVVLPLWIATGLLVPVVVLAPVLGPAAIERDRQAGATDLWASEQILVMVSLVGIGIGLPIALVAYVSARWPAAWRGPLAVPEPPGGTHALQVSMARLAAVGCVPLGLVKLYWACGGTVGLGVAGPDQRDEWWHLLSFNTGAWALAGGWGLLALTARRGAPGFLPPMAAVWVSSGVLFSQSLYGALSAARPEAPPAPETGLARVLTTESGVVLGVVMATTLFLLLHERHAHANQSLTNAGYLTTVPTTSVELRGHS